MSNQSPKHPLRHLPAALVATRACLGPVILALTLIPGQHAALIVIAIWIAVLSDIFDGIIARRIGVATSLLRRCDSMADLFFFLCVLISGWLGHAGALRPHLTEIMILLVLEAACNAVSLIRFRKTPATHAISAKLFGLSLLGAFTALFGWGVTGIPWYTMFTLGLITDADLLAILLLLPRWTNDIPSCYHAWLIRRGRPIRRNPLFN